MRLKLLLTNLFFVSTILCTSAGAHAQTNSYGTSPDYSNSYSNDYSNPYGNTQTNTGYGSEYNTGNINTGGNVGAEIRGTEVENGGPVSTTSGFLSYFRCLSGHYHASYLNDGHKSCPNKQNAPIDGGLSILIAAGAAFGFKRAYKNRKKAGAVTAS